MMSQNILIVTWYDAASNCELNGACLMGWVLSVFKGVHFWSNINE